MSQSTPPPSKGEKARRPRRFPRLRKGLARIGAALLALVMAAAFYLAVIMGQPDPEGVEADAASPAAQELLNAQPAYQIQEESQVMGLVDQFPVPALTLHENPGLTFSSGRSYDQAYEGGFARWLELVYLTADGQRVVLESLYPARAFELMSRDGYALNTLTQTALAGQPAVQMTGDAGIRVHTQGEEAIYILTAPALSAETLAEITRATTLTTPLPTLMEAYERGD